MARAHMIHDDNTNLLYYQKNTMVLKQTKIR